MTARQKHLASVRTLIANMVPTQRMELTAEKLVRSYGLTEDEAERFMRGMR